MIRPLPPTRFFALSAPLAASDSLFVGEVTKLPPPISGRNINHLRGSLHIKSTLSTYAPRLSRGAPLAYHEVRRSP